MKRPIYISAAKLTNPYYYSLNNGREGSFSTQKMIPRESPFFKGGPEIIDKKRP